MGTAKRGRRPELRVRTGCRRCRERRVKCPEQRPVCRSCELRGHVCSYELVLRWQDVEVLPNGCGTRHKTSSGYTQHWMFLNASPRDFNNRQSLLSSPDSPGSERQSTPEDQHPESLHQQPLAHEPPQYTDNALTYWDIDNTTDFSSWLELLDSNQCNSPWQSFQANFTIPPALSFLQMSPIESHLWEYFQKAISPSCVLNPKANPYQDVILRITAYGGRSSPVFQGVMSISAAQLYNLGDRSFLESSWTYRQQALQSLRLETAKYEAEGQDVMRAGQIVAAILLMVFLEISHDCPDSWVLHANFGRSLIQSIEKHKILDPDIQSLFTFVKAYIVSHEVFAHTAWKPAERYEYNNVIDDLSGDDNIQTMTGCSTEFLQILSGVNVLAADVKKHTESASQSVEETRALDQRRLELERRLHGWNRDQQPNQTDKDIPESILIAETKRLAGLLYLYSRTSHLGPRDPCILRLTSRILDLISKVTFRTSAVLWPLFMVATLGVRPECDADRAAVLERIDSLQRTRQLGSVKKARKLIDNVWKLRDLKPSASNLGWDILELTACQDKLSLA